MTKKLLSTDSCKKFVIIGKITSKIVIIFMIISFILSIYYIFSGKFKLSLSSYLDAQFMMFLFFMLKYYIISLEEIIFNEEKEVEVFE